MPDSCHDGNLCPRGPSVGIAGLQSTTVETSPKNHAAPLRRSAPTWSRSPLKEIVKKEIRILVLEDVPADVVLINHELRRGGLDFSAQRVETREEFLRELEKNPPDVILSDHGLPGFDGFTALALARDKCPETPFIFVTGSMGEELAIDSLRSGATDYVLKTRMSNLVPAVQRALHLAEERVKRRNAEKELRESEERFRTLVTGAKDQEESLRKSEEALRKSEERFRLLVEGVEDYAITMLDTHGRITTWNIGAERITGYRAQEIVGRRFQRFYTADDVERNEPDQALEIATTEGRFQDERWLTRKDGTQYCANFVITARRDEGGNLTGFSTIARDVTQRKRAEDEIRRLNAELEQRVQERTAELQAAYQEMEAFSYSISHDLRAPLIHIAGFVELLKSDLGATLDEKSKRHLQTICDSAEGMGRMIADLLTFSRIGRAEMHKVRFNLTDTIAEVRRDLQASARNRKVTWIVAEMPEVYGDPFLLRQALFNLLSNALKYTQRREEARIEIGAETSPQEHIFAVRDNGAGFDMKYAGRLFGVFQRLHSNTDFEGTGIGLANVRRIISRHGGRTWAEGVVDGGATFYFTLPNLPRSP
jgi:PAS domain S-box-containing protein